MEIGFYVLMYRRADPGTSVLAYPIGDMGSLDELFDGLLGNEFVFADENDDDDDTLI